tara:strand:+ start:8737 stop:9087 length:351 start_codon:yes stop_codon:yes gene_type:complete
MSKHPTGFSSSVGTRLRLEMMNKQQSEADFLSKEEYYQKVSDLDPEITEDIFKLALKGRVNDINTLFTISRALEIPFTVIIKNCEELFHKTDKEILEEVRKNLDLNNEEHSNKGKT